MQRLNAKVSVIIPTYNRLDCVLECVECVRQQTLHPHEVLVVDDGSTDHTAECLERRFGDTIRILRQDNQGQATATRHALSQATGDLVAFVDSDDLWNKDKLSKQVSILAQFPDVVAVHTDAEQFDVEDPAETSSYLDHHPTLRDTNRLMEAMVRGHVPLRSTVVVRKAFLDRHVIKPYPEAMDKDDIQMFMEILGCGGRFYLLDEVTVRRAMHSGNISKDYFYRYARRVTTYQNLLARRPDFPKSWRRQVSRALADAEFRVGEWYWGRGDLVEARRHFWRAVDANLFDWRPRAWLILSTFPRQVVTAIRRIRGALAPQRS